MLGAASDLIDAADIPLAAEHGVVRAVLVDPRAKALSLPEIKSERIDGANLRGADWPRCGQRPEQHATLVHPCSAIGAYERHCNIFGTIEAGGEGAARRTPRHDQGSPV